MKFAGHICWDANDLQWVAPIDAAAVASDDAIFLATHHPLSIRRSADSETTDGAWVDEAALLAEFKRPVGNDPHVVVISGATGTGKSHLVKWLHASSDDPKWHVVYIEKRNTSLRRVITTILHDFKGPAIDDLREKLEVAQATNQDLEETKDRLLAELATRVEFPEDSEEAPMAEQARKILPDLLRDPVLRNHFLGKSRAIDRITRLGIEGLTEDTDDSELFISEDDLPIDPADLAEASAPGMKAVKQLARSRQLRSMAVEILNRELPPAKATVLLGTGIDLIGVFDEVRRELHSRGLELALFIEDLVLTQGIDKELAQVFTEGRGAEGLRCGMRVAIAVTDGYLASGFETLRSRASHFSLNLAIGSDVSYEDARSFVARYLNATRLGVDALRSGLESGAIDDWLPNACEGCKFREPCHEAFGADDNGWGYYPLNETAVDRLVKLLARRTDGRFEPREVVREVLRDPLERAQEELPDARFPSPRFAAMVDEERRSVSVGIRHQLEQDQDGDRRLSLLGFWAPEPVDELRNVADGIHTAFQLPPLDGREKFAPPIETETTGTVQTPSPPRVDQPVVDEWANGDRVLPASFANKVRKFVFDSLINGVRSGAHGRRVLSKGKGAYTVGNLETTLKSDCVQIDAAQGGGAEVERPFEILLDRSAGSAVMIKAILRAESGEGWGENPSEAIDRYSDFVTCLDGWTKELVQASASSAKSYSLLELALSAGMKPAKEAALGERLEAFLQPPASSEGRTKELRDFSAQAQKSRQAVLRHLEADLSAAKGGGASSLIDGAQLLKELRTLSSPVAAVEKVEKGEAPRLDDLIQKLETAEVSEWKVVSELLDSVLDHLDDGESWEDLRTGLRTTVERANQGGLLPRATTLEDLNARAERVPDDAVITVRRLAGVAEASRDLWQLTPDPSIGLMALKDYTEFASEVLESVEQKLGGPEGSNPSAGPGEVISAMRTLSNEIQACLDQEDS